MIRARSKTAKRNLGRAGIVGPTKEGLACFFWFVGPWKDWTSKLSLVQPRTIYGQPVYFFFKYEVELSIFYEENFEYNTYFFFQIPIRAAYLCTIYYIG